MQYNHRLTRISLLIVTCLGLLSGCANLSYYLHSVNGHYDIMNRTRPIPDWLADSATDPELAQKLARIEQIRDFAMNDLGLPESESYSLYADIGRNYVVKNLFAAEEFSIRPYQWCYVVVGCMGYRGYFDEQRLERYREQMQQQGFDLYVTRVTAYSTLGWFDDPVLNTFINWPEHRLAGLIFHELAHQQLYLDGDTPFNESFAMAVQYAGVERWLQANDQTDKLQRYRQYLQNRRQVTSLIESARQDLGRLYQTEMAVESMRQAKQDRLQQLQSDYAELTASFAVKDGFKNWFASGLNNAKLASVSTYYTQVPAFRARLEQLDGNFPLFYQQVAELATLTREQRADCLQYWAQTDTATTSTNQCP